MTAARPGVTGHVPVEGPDPRLTATLVRADAGADAGHLLVCIHGGGCNARYFDLRGFSLAEAAAQRGFDVLMVNRPGHGDSAAPASATPLAEAAALLPAFVAAAIERHVPKVERVSAVGHSIGGAVALRWAAADPGRVAAVAISGIGTRPSAGASSWWRDAARTSPLELPTDYFFGPDGSYDWRGPTALRKAAEPWRFDDVREVLEDWPGTFPAIAEHLACPVHWRLAEHERIWAHDGAALDDLAAALGHCPVADVDLVTGPGHLIEVHKDGGAFVDQQLTFLQRAADSPVEHWGPHDGG